MEMNNLFKYVGIGVLVVVVIMFLIKITNFQFKIIEGLQNKATKKPNVKYEDMTEHAVKAVKEKNTTLRSSLNLDDTKVQKNYEDLINEYADLIDILMFQNIFTQFNPKNDLDEANMKTIAKVNELKTFKDALEDVETYLKSGGGGADGDSSSSSGWM